MASYIWYTQNVTDKGIHANAHPTVMPTTDSVDGRTASFESQDEPAAPPALPHSIRNHLWTLVTLAVTTMTFTFGIPAYHASIAIIARDTTMLGESPYLRSTSFLNIVF